MLSQEQEQMVVKSFWWEELGKMTKLATLQSLIYSEESAKIVKDVEEQDVVLFIGNTGSGKSTIANHVIGNKLEAINIVDNNYKIVKENEEDRGPIIGIEATSEVTVPTAWKSRNINSLVVDGPSFNDNIGEVQDIVNAFYINELIINAHSVVFVLVTDIQEIISDKIGQFINFLNKVNTILPQFYQLMKFMIVVFNNDKDDTTSDEVIDYLNKNIIKQTTLNIQSRYLIEFLIQNPKHFVVCSTPTKGGRLSKDIFGTIDTAIEQHSYAIPNDYLSDFKTGVSEISKNFLIETRIVTTELKEISESFENILMLLSNYYHDIKKMMDFDEMKQFAKPLSGFGEKVKSIKHMQSETIYLRRVGEYLLSEFDLHEASQIYMKLAFSEFVYRAVLGSTTSKLFSDEFNEFWGKITISIFKSMAILFFMDHVVDQQHKSDDKQLKEMKNSVDCFVQ